ncbi:MAG: cytochrome c oxidase subunit II [Phycisphaerales bacterium]|nr:MAG: cytochrome c oxidase subunit II [Phycisphaerales bacterium]
MLAQQEGSFWLPIPGTSLAGEVDLLFKLILWISVFFFALIVAVMVLFVIRYRRRTGWKAEKTATHSTALEVTWTIIPLILVIVIFYAGFKGFMALATPPVDAYKIVVEGQKWSWLFTYPNGHVDSELHVPAKRNVELVLTSLDVIHSFYIPAFRLKKDAVPGRYTRMWFNALHPGEHTVFCAEYCGTGHSDMSTKVVVHAPEDFEAWLESADPLKKLSDEQYAEYMKDPAAFIATNPEVEGLATPAMMGEQLYRKKGCVQCHSVDGAAGTGPSFLNLYGASRALADGASVEADENYIRNSILNPGGQVVAGYESVMPTYQGRLKEREITAIIAYLESLSDSAGDAGPSEE